MGTFFVVWIDVFNEAKTIDLILFNFDDRMESMYII